MASDYLVCIFKLVLMYYTLTFVYYHYLTECLFKWLAVLFVEEIGVHGENHRPVASP
jgi:hypothetical protein